MRRKDEKGHDDDKPIIKYANQIKEKLLIETVLFR